MDEIFKRILDNLAGADLWIALGFLAAGFVCWIWLGTTARGKKVLRRQIGMALFVAILAGAIIFVNHSFFLREPRFSKNLTGVLVTRIVGDDALNSLQGALVEKLNAELQKEDTGEQIEVHASGEILNENDGLKVAHEHARAIGQRLNAKIVIWGRKIGEKQFYPRITVMAAMKDWGAVRERTHDEQSITELHLPKELVDEPFYLVHFAAGYSYFVQGKYREALSHFKAALGREGALANELADLQFLIGFCHYSLGASDTAIANFDEAIRLDPKIAAAYNDRGILYQAKGDYDKAIADYDEAIRIDPKNVEPHNNRAAAYQVKRDYDKAIADYDEAIRIDPKRVEPHNNRGILYQAKGDYDKAIADYNEAIRIDPKRVEPHYNRGILYQAKGDYDNAIADYDEAIRIDPNLAIRIDPKYSLAYYDRGSLHQAKGDYDKAIADYDEAIRIDPKNVDAYNEVAWLRATCPQASLRDGKKAVEYATKACELSNWKDPNMLDTLAAAYAELGDFEQAIKWETNFLETASLSETSGKSRLALYQTHRPYHAEK
jgi:tetratricopeptide (TPR) repeat protein